MESADAATGSLLLQNDPSAPLTLPPLIARGLSDRLYERRKAAALELERMVREAFSTLKSDSEKTALATKLMTHLIDEYLYSMLPNARNGGLIGMAACAIALGGTDLVCHLDQMMPPLLSCLTDNDNRVRYYACESLYNVAKVARQAILPFFDRLFDASSKLVADPETTVRNACGLLDRLLKDIVAAAKQLDVTRLLPLIRERIRVRHAAVRQFIVSWLQLLDTIPNVNLHCHLEVFLDGLMSYLSVHSTPLLNGPMLLPVLNAVQNVSSHSSTTSLPLLLQQQQLQQQQQTSSSSFDEMHHSADVKAATLSLLNALLLSCQTALQQQPNTVNTAQLIQLWLPFVTADDVDSHVTALTWLECLCHYGSRDLVLPHLAALLDATLPCLSDGHLQTREQAKQLHHRLIQVWQSKEDFHSNKETLKWVVQVLATKLHSTAVGSAPPIVLQATEATRIACLQWLARVHEQEADVLTDSSLSLLDALLAVLSDPSEEVVKKDLRLLSQWASTSSSNDYFEPFVGLLLQRFRQDRRLLETRGAFVIRQLCACLPPERLYRALALHLEREQDLVFAGVMVQNLTVILLTSHELTEMRRRLRVKASAGENPGNALFPALYRCWSHNPVSTLTLCLLAQAYDNGVQLVHYFSEMEMTVPLLVQLDKLVQLLESPVFTALRLQLLDAEKYPSLYKCLYGILMVLPQSSAFATLRNRLSSVSHAVAFLKSSNTTALSNSPSSSALRKSNSSMAEGNALFLYFQQVQSRHEQYRRQLLGTPSRSSHEQLDEAMKLKRKSSLNVINDTK